MKINAQVCFLLGTVSVLLLNGEEEGRRAKAYECKETLLAASGIATALDVALSDNNIAELAKQKGLTVKGLVKLRTQAQTAPRRRARARTRA